MTIDIAIPTSGRSSLADLLSALDRQRPLPGALIVVDDRPAGAARDLTALVPRALHPSLAIARAGGRGPAAARNLGWRSSRAEWVAFLDDDVVPDPDWLARLGDDLRGLGPSVAASQGTVRVPRPARATDWERSVGGLESASYITADMAFRVEALRAAQGFDERFPRAFREDSELACRLLTAGWSIVRGTRSVVHPVPPAPRLISVERQRGNADDALMWALHGARWRQRAHAPAGRRPLHIATTAAAATGIAALLLRRGALGKAALSGWVAGTLELTIARVRPGPRTGDEIATMALTSALLPATATAHWLLGLLRWKVLSRPRPLPTRGPLVHDEQHEAAGAPSALPHRVVIVFG
jgi:hypothetical protein